MKIYPAIDIMRGRVVRLYQGRTDKIKKFGDPLKIASEFAKYVDKVHIVDLDGAFKGTPKNLHIVKRIIKDTGLKVQIGGGFRSYEAVEGAYSIGVENVIIGTGALDIGFLDRVVKDFRGITVSLDVRDGQVAIDGWRRMVINVSEAFLFLRTRVGRFIYTEIERDGTMQGVRNIKPFWEEEEFIYAGGVSKSRDVLKLQKLNFSGVIVGRALYEGSITLPELLEVV